MNSFTHFLLSFNVMLIFFHRIASIKEIVLFSLVFSVIIDFDEIIHGLIRKKQGPKGKKFTEFDHGNLRTWLQEPFGFVIFGIPIAILLFLFSKPYYSFLVLIPYALHIITDYMTIHKGTAPLAPFSKKTFKTGFIKPMPAPPWFKSKKGFPENYILLANILIAVVLILIYL